MFGITSVILLLKACFVSKLAGASHSWLMGPLTTLKPFQFYIMIVVSQAKSVALLPWSVSNFAIMMGL